MTLVTVKPLKKRAKQISEEIDCNQSVKKQSVSTGNSNGLHGILIIYFRLKGRIMRPCRTRMSNDPRNKQMQLKETSQ